MHYLATFHPQVWINDSAYDAEPLGPTQWDACAFMAAIPEQERDAYMEPDTDTSDRLQADPAAPHWIRVWTGPFYVSVEEVETLPGHIKHRSTDDPAPAHYEIVLRIEVDSTHTPLSAQQHARAIGAYLGNTIGQVLRISHESGLETTDRDIQTNSPNTKAVTTGLPAARANVLEPRFRITVRPLVPREEMDYEDRQDYDDIVGDHELEAHDEESALDQFHGKVAIACLDDFEITCTPLRDYRVHWSTDIFGAASAEEAAREAFETIRLDDTSVTTFTVVDHASHIGISVRVDLTDQD